MPDSADCVSEARQLLLLEQGLVRRYESVVAPEVVRQVVRKHAAFFDGARVRVFVPVLVERAARSDLDIVSAGATRARPPDLDPSVRLVNVA